MQTFQDYVNERYDFPAGSDYNLRLQTLGDAFIKYVDEVIVPDYSKSKPSIPATNKELRDTLETASNGIRWWIKEHPASASEADYEMLAEIKKVLEQ